MAPLARRPAASRDPAAALDRGTQAKGETAADSAVGRRDAGVLGVEPGAAGQAAGGHLFPPDRDRTEAGLGGERPRAAAGGIARGGAAEEWRWPPFPQREARLRPQRVAGGRR